MIFLRRHCREIKFAQPSEVMRKQPLGCFVAMLLAMTAFFFVSSARAKVLDIKEVTSGSGLTAWLVEDHSIPVIALQFSFKGAGSSNELPEMQGLVRVASNTMDEGAGDLDSQAFQKELQDLSISLRFNASRDDFGGHVKTLTANKTRAFELLKLALTEPRFDEEPLGRMIEANKSRIRSSMANPNWIAARLMNDVAFEGHPYALNSGGTLSSLPTITPAMLRAYVKTHLSRDRLKIGVAGNITAEELKILLDDVFGALPEEALKSDDTPDLELQNEGGLFLYEKDIPQTIISMYQPGIARNDPDYHTAQIMNFVLGSSGFGSRLTEEIREKAGLTYGIYSSLQTMDHINLLGVNTSTINASTGKMLEMVREEWKKMMEGGITKEELTDAQNYLIGSLPLSLTSTDKIASLLLSIQMDGFDADYLDKREAAIRDASVDDVNRVAKKLLQSRRFVTVLVGKPENITPTKTVTSLPNVE